MTHMARGGRVVLPAIALALTLLATGCVRPGGTTPAPDTVGEAAKDATRASDSRLSTAGVEFAAEWRAAWEEQIAWSRAVVVGIADRGPGTEDAQSRLVTNADDMAALLAPYYGEAKAARFGHLMSEHSALEASLVEAMRAGDTTRAMDVEPRWYANAHSIAALLSTADASAPDTTMTAMFKTHLAIIKQQASDRIAGEYGAEVVDFDRLHRQTLKMSDAISTSIRDQFPERF